MNSSISPTSFDVKWRPLVSACLVPHSNLLYVFAPQFEREIDALEPAEAPGVEPVDFPAAENLNIFVTTEQWFGDQWRAAEAFRPLVTPGFKACRDSLPHWNVFGPNGEPVKTVTKVNGVR